MKKGSVLITICIIVVIIALGLLAYYLYDEAKRKNGENTTGKTTGKISNASPILELSSYPLDETDGDVEISIEAKMEDGSEIVSVTTPDGNTSGYTPDKTYTVDKNGEYSFTVRAANGKETTKSIDIQNITKISSDNPYIPEGFKHIEGTEVDTGFVIEDKNENQYVWVPVKSGMPERTATSDKFVEDNYTASALNNSIAKYYGFYIAKYEASKDTVNGIVVAKSVGDVIPWSNVTYDDAFDAAKNTATAYNYIGVKTALMNSYAWDATLNWLNTKVTNYSTSRSYGNYSNQILATGATESDIVNEITDMAGNLREWTTERYIEENEDSSIVYRTVRGGSATMDKIANSRIGERTDLKDNYWGFRIVLYKE